MDQRVYAVMQVLRKQELPPPSNLQAITWKLNHRTEPKKTIEELAESVKLSETRLRALFKSEIGLTPRQYVKKIKMDAAAELLRETHLKVNDIAAILEANSISRFVDDFKKAHGMTPTAYRKFHHQQVRRESSAGNTAPMQPAIMLSNE